MLKTISTLVSLLATCGLFAPLASKADDLITVAMSGTVVSVTEVGELGETLPSELAVGKSVELSASFADAVFPRGRSNDGGIPTAGRRDSVAPVDLFLVLDGSLSLRDETAYLLLSHDAEATQKDPFPPIAEILRFENLSDQVFSDTLNWHLEGGLSTAGDNLVGGELLSEGTFWNSFENRRFELVIDSPTRTGQFRVAVEVGPATIVPEPASVFSLLVTLSMVTALRRPNCTSAR